MRQGRDALFDLVRLHQVEVAAGVFNHQGVRVGFISFALEAVVIKKSQVDPAAGFPLPTIPA